MKPAPVQGGTLSTFATSSRTELVASLRRSLLDFSPEFGPQAGTTARAYLKERLYDTRGRDADIIWPYAVMRLDSEQNGRNNGQRLAASLEIQIHGRPWSQATTVNAIADLFDGAMLCLRMTSQGLAFNTTSQRNQLGPAGAPADSETVTVRLAYGLGIWPRYLTSLTSPGV